MDKRPNILFLMSDQHRFDICGFTGNKTIRTPNLDRLAEDAAIFDNCYTPSPVCVPARQAIAVGKLPWNCGCINYGDDLEPHSMTFARRFSQYGYKTVCCGKLHHSAEDQNQGWMLRVGYDNEVTDRFIDGLIQEERDKYKPAESQWWNWTREVQNAGIGESPYTGRDRIAINGALQVLKEHFISPFYDRPEHRPLFLKVSLHNPHYPYATDEQKFKYYYDKVKTFYRETAMDHPVVTRDWDQLSPEVTENEVRRATAAYYGQIEKTDEMFGEIIDYLEEIGQDLDNWIIVYTSDHGDMIGEHGIWMKYKYYEGSAKVPFFIRFPQNIYSHRITENINLCDLFATLCDLTGIDCVEGLDSRSLKPLLEKSADNWDNTSISQLGDTCMIKQGNLKYQYLGKGQKDVLFDLERDPNEKICFIDEPEYVGPVADFRLKVAEMLKNIKEDK